MVKGLCSDRQMLVNALAERLGCEASYAGAPKFSYIIGEYEVTRDGDLKVPEKADFALLDELAGAGLIERVRKPADRHINVPAEGMTGRCLSNFVRILASKEKLINKAIGRDNAFHVPPVLIKSIETDRPGSAEEFFTVLSACGGEKAVKGVRFGADEISFIGFPYTDDGDEEDANLALAGLLTEAARAKRWAKLSDSEPSNEKYAFRVWLNSIGMKGKGYARSRAALLKRLDGDAAYRTVQQKEAARIKRTSERIEKEQTRREDFVLL